MFADAEALTRFDITPFQHVDFILQGPGIPAKAIQMGSQSNVRGKQLWQLVTESRTTRHLGVQKCHPGAQKRHPGVQKRHLVAPKRRLGVQKHPWGSEASARDSEALSIEPEGESDPM